MCVGILFKIQLRRVSPPLVCSSSRLWKSFVLFFFSCISKKRLSIEMIMESGCFSINFRNILLIKKANIDILKL